MSRNNADRFGATPQDAPIPQETVNNTLQFVTPTEFVNLPSKGLGYEPSHPLHGQETVEIKYMTAKEEDILSSKTLLKRGVALERFMENIIIDKRIKPNTLLSGDRNAIVIAARISGYGANYETMVSCPACGEKSTFNFDLNDQSMNESVLLEELKITSTGNGTFKTTMPHTDFEVEFKLLRGEDENYLSSMMADKRKRKIIESSLTDQYRRMIVGVQGYTDGTSINKYVTNMPTLDSRHLRLCYKAVCPDVRINNNFVCPSCDHEEEVDVPFGTDFFWPDR